MFNSKKECWYIAFVLHGKNRCIRIDNARNEREAREQAANKLIGLLFQPFCMDRKDDIAAQRQANDILTEMLDTESPQVTKPANKPFSIFHKSST